MRAIKSHDMKKQKLLRARSKGFTLIETALIIMILSLVLTPLYGMILQQKAQKREMERESVDKSILTALSVYLRENGAYPCPADPTLPATDLNFGLEIWRTVTIPADAAAMCNMAAPATPFGPGNSLLRGDLPVAALGLPPEAAANRQGRKYIYVVTRNLTGSSSYNGAGALTIRNGLTGTLNITTTAPFAIIDTGPDMRGSYPLNGSATPLAMEPCPTTPPHPFVENCNTNNIFRDAPYSATSNPGSATYFDDTIVYSMAREESTLWTLTPAPDALNTGRLNMVNRNSGNIGINLPAATPPGATVHVQGDVRVQRNPSTGGGNLDIDGRIGSDVFYYNPP